MGSSLKVGLKTRLATSRSTKPRCVTRTLLLLSATMGHVQGRLRRRRCPQGRLPLHCWTSPPPGSHGRYGTPVTVSPTVSPSTRVTLSPTPLSVLTWLAVSSPTPDEDPHREGLLLHHHCREGDCP